MHPRHWKHGGEKRIAFGGGVSLEPTTENMVEICRIAEGLSLRGQLFLFLIQVKGGTMMGETIVNTGSEGLLEILRFGGNQEDSSPVSGWVFHPAGKAVKGYKAACSYTPSVDPTYIFHESARDVERRRSSSSLPYG